MEEYLKKSESTVSVESGAKSTEDMELISSKRRKVYSAHEKEYYSDGEEFLENSVSSESSGVGKIKSLRSTDLENFESHFEEFDTEISTSINGFFREMTPTSEFCGDSEQMFMDTSIGKLQKKSPPPMDITRRKIQADQKMPPEKELEEFFAAAEKGEQKRFAEKYNYDFVKDVPLEGKYQWVRLHL